MPADVIGPAQWPPDGWRRGGLSASEDHRLAILAAKPHCHICERLFKPGYESPDLVCRDCRAEQDAPPPDPALF